MTPEHDAMVAAGLAFQQHVDVCATCMPTTPTYWRLCPTGVPLHEALTATLAAAKQATPIQRCPTCGVEHRAHSKNCKACVDEACGNCLGLLFVSCCVAFVLAYVLS